jgi:Type II secretion system (T2SS), protein G
MPAKSDDIKVALDRFQADCARYPTTEEGLSALVKNPGVVGWKGPYWNGDFCDRYGTPWGYENKERPALLYAGPKRKFGRPGSYRVTWSVSY